MEDETSLPELLEVDSVQVFSLNLSHIIKSINYKMKS